MRYVAIIISVLLLTSCGSSTDSSHVFSLTGDDYTGSKYYFGFAKAGSFDPSMMHNEVKFDLLHTHDIFTEDIGGNYLSNKYIGSPATSSNIRSKWSEIGDAMTADDMYVQYSSGHGYSSGLAVGVSYNDIRDNALSYPGREIIIFTMACYSGSLVDSFNRRRSDWEGWGEEGRSLLVMASSQSHETSSTGPGTDPDEPNGPNGSAGSAFGHALWKSLIGYSDGYLDGVKDGYISLDEIVEYTKWKTYNIGQHQPVVTGTYNGNVLMNRVPPRSFVDSYQNSTEGMSEQEIAELVAELDRTMRL